MYDSFVTMNSWNQEIDVIQDTFGDERVMAIHADSETIYITKEQAMAFFGLVESANIDS